MTVHQIVRVVGAAPVRGLLTGGPVGPGNWRMSPGQPDAIVSDNHTLGRCYIGGRPYDAAIDYEAGYGGHFVCESVRPEYRALIVEAPRMLRALTDAADYIERNVPTIADGDVKAAVMVAYLRFVCAFAERRP